MISHLPPCVAGIGDGPIAILKSACRNHTCGTLQCHARNLAKDTHVFHQRDVPTHVHWVGSGLLRLYHTLGNGKRQIVGFAFPGEFVDLAAGPKYHMSAQAVIETKIRSMPRATFKAAARADPEFSFQLFISVSERLARASDLALTVGQRSAAAGLAAFLIEMHNRVAVGNPTSHDLFLPMPRSDIADYLGLTTETVSRVFTKFKRQGLVTINNRRRVKLLALGALQRLTQGLSADNAS